MPATHERENRLTVPLVGEQIATSSKPQPKHPRREQTSLSPDEIDRIAVYVTGRLAGQLRNLRIVARHDGIVLHGYVPSYYAKLLVQEAVMSATNQAIAENAIEVL